MSKTHAADDGTKWSTGYGSLCGLPPRQIARVVCKAEVYAVGVDCKAPRFQGRWTVTDFFYGPAPRAKTVHFGGAIRDDGAVSALCYARPRPVDLRVATWTNRREAVTCAKCKARLASRREGGER